MLWMFLLDVTVKSSALIACAWGLRWLLPKDRPDVMRFLWVGVVVALTSLVVCWPLLPAIHLNLFPEVPVVTHGNAMAAGSVMGSVQPAAEAGFTWQSGLLLSYWIGLAFFALRFLLGYGLSYRLARQSIAPEDSRFRAFAFDLASEFKLQAPIDLRISQVDHSPFTLGWLRPKIVLPTQALEWSDERLRAVLLHEIAHIRAGDYGVMLLMRALTVAFWFNPLMWLAQRHLVSACEHSGDAFVVSCGMKASSYADHLLQIARSLRHQQSHFVPAMARVSELEGRLIAILDSHLPKSKPFAAVRGAILGSVMFLGSLLSSLSPWGLPDQQMGLARMSVDERLVLIHDVRSTCMFANQLLNREPEHMETVTLADHTYYVQDEECANNLDQIPSARFAIDPFTNQAVDKADAVIAKFPNNSHVVYFASVANLDSFNKSMD